MHTFSKHIQRILSDMRTFKIKSMKKNQSTITQMDIDYYNGLIESLNRQYILKLEQEIRSWSIIVNNLKEQGAPLTVWKCASNEVSKRVKEINKIKSQLNKNK